MNALELKETVREMERQIKAYGAAATATVADLLKFPILQVTGAYALTLPSACSELAGGEWLVLADGAATVVDPAGFGGAGALLDTATLADGETLSLYCDGTYWYLQHNEPAGAT